MSKVEHAEALVSVRPKRKFGLRYFCGCAVCGESACGDSGLFGWLYGCGIGLCGDLSCGSDDELTGIYQTRQFNGHVYNERMGFYWPRYTRTDGQGTLRDKFAAAITAWQALTSQQKQVYNTDAIGKKMSGYNLFISNYLKNN